MAEPVTKSEAEQVVPGLPAEAAVGDSAFTWREIAVFGSILTTVLLSANALVCATWGHFFGLPGWLAWQCVPGLFAVAFVPSTILRFRSTHLVLRVAYAISASWIGFLNFAFFAAIACWIAEGMARIFGWPLPFVPTASILFGLAFATGAYGLANASRIRVSRITIRLPRLPAAWQGRTVALLTDLHLGPLSGSAFLRRVLDRLRELKPEVVFISGDMFDGPTIGLPELVAPWLEYHAPRGVYYVTGNHDEFAERSIYLKAVSGCGIQVLNNEKVSIDGLQIVGIHDSEATNPPVLREILSRAAIDRQGPSILLAHRPVNLAVAAEAGVSLQLSGHTHGGQIWPWNLLVSRIYGRFASGLSRLDKLQVYTSNGIGTWGPPLRVGTRSELVLLRLEKE